MCLISYFYNYLNSIKLYPRIEYHVNSYKPVSIEFNSLYFVLFCYELKRTYTRFDTYRLSGSVRYGKHYRERVFLINVPHWNGSKEGELKQRAYSLQLYRMKRNRIRVTVHIPLLVPMLQTLEKHFEQVLNDLYLAKMG